MVMLMTFPLIKPKTPSIRQTADFLPVKANKQSKVNRIRIRSKEE